MSQSTASPRGTAASCPTHLRHRWGPRPGQGERKPLRVLGRITSIYTGRGWVTRKSSYPPPERERRNCWKGAGGAGPGALGAPMVGSCPRSPPGPCSPPCWRKFPPVEEGIISDRGGNLGHGRERDGVTDPCSGHIPSCLLAHGRTRARCPAIYLSVIPDSRENGGKKKEKKKRDGGDGRWRRGARPVPCPSGRARCGLSHGPGAVPAG